MFTSGCAGYIVVSSIDGSLVWLQHTHLDKGQLEFCGSLLSAVCPHCCSNEHVLHILLLDEISRYFKLQLGT